MDCSSIRFIVTNIFYSVRRLNSDERDVGMRQSFETSIRIITSANNNI